MNPVDPRTEEDLEHLAQNGLLEESHGLDLKRELGSGNAANKDLAKDIAAFSLDGGTILIGAHDRGAEVHVWVDDDGPGIPVEARERVFERFQRLAENAPGGCGLGLAIVKALVQQLGLSMPIGLGTPELSERFGITTIPYLLLVDKNGQVRRIFRGVHGAAELGRAVEEAGF